MTDGGADSERGQKGLQGGWPRGGLMEDQHRHHQSETNFSDKIPRHAAWILGRAWDRDRHPRGQAAPTANGHEGGGPP